MTATIIAYILTALATFFGVTNMVQAVVAGVCGQLLRKITGHPDHLSGIGIGALAAWGLVGYLWKTFEGRPIPLAALGMSWLLIWLVRIANKDTLNHNAQLMASAEVWVIAAISAYIMLTTSPIRWY